MVGAQLSPVLLVGEVAPRLQAELALQGLPCAVAFDQNDAVNRMRSTSFPFVVVPSVFGDGYSGVSFTQGLLQYFDTQVIVYGNGLEQNDLSALLRTGRVAHFPADAEGRVVADFLARRTRSNSKPPAPSSSPPTFNLTPGPPASSASFPPAPTTDPTLSPAFFGGSAAVPRPPTMGPSPGLATPTPQPAPPHQRLEAVVDELVRAQSELQTLRGRVTHMDQERAALLVEVEAARRSSIAQVAEVMALSDEGDPISDELEALRARATNLDNELGAVRAESEMLRAERERLVAEAAAAASTLAETRERADAADGLLRDLHEAQASEAAKAEAALAEVERLRREVQRLDDDAALQRAAAAGATADTAALRAELESAGTDGAALRAELERSAADAAALRAELERIGADAAGLRADGARVAGEAARLRGELEAARGQRGEVERLAHELEAARSQQGEVERLTRELERHARALVESRSERDTIERQLAAERSAHSSALEQQRTDLELQHGEALAKASQHARGSADESSALRIESDKLKADLAAARTDATTVRLDLQEATMRQDEATQQLTALASERDALRAEAAPLRDWANQLVVDHARQQEELERMRGSSLTLEERARTIAQLQAQVSELSAERDRLKAQGGGGSADAEVLMARARQLAGLVSALEPFMWGLTQAAQFFTKHPVEGGEQHLKLLQQLQGVLLRLRDEIAMLDLG
ncbi:MAG: hypothetical protein IT383_28910 [Deltaproteobacteria bacterium]|nr:hypothetical protein [Deltaproteobacteria bacterium]